MAGVVPGQMALDLFPEERAARKKPLEDCVEHLVSRGCDEGIVRPIARDLLDMFGAVEGLDRAYCLGYFFGSRPIRAVVGESPESIGMFDKSIDHNVLWDRLWAARWVDFGEAVRVMRLIYNYRKPYTGAPIYIWYIDNDGREVKRPYLEEECER